MEFKNTTQTPHLRKKHTPNDINVLADLIDSLKMSTLMNAAKISSQVHERTIGPEISASIENLNINNDNNGTDGAVQINGYAKVIDMHTKSPKFRTDVWREVKMDEEDETPRKLIPLSDCKLVRFRLAANSAEKQRRSQININLQERQSKTDKELEERLQQIRIDSAAEAQQRIQQKIREREQSLQAAIQQIEDEANGIEEQERNENNLRMEQNRKLLEQVKLLRLRGELRTLLEAVNTSKTLFINLYEAYAKSVIQHQTQLEHVKKLDKYKQFSESILTRYEKIINAINAKQITTVEVESLDILCQEIRNEQNEVNNDIVKGEEEIAAAANALQESKQAEAAAVAIAVATEAAVTASIAANAANNVGESVVDGSRAHMPVITASSNQYVHPDRLTFYNDLMKFYDENRAQVQPLLDDINMKKFRFNCQKAVNTPVNAISAVNAQHLEDKFIKLKQLLSGMQVVAGDVQFSAAEHPRGVLYCTILLAKKFVNQATTISTSSNPHSAFPIASVIVSIWQIFPHFGQFFLALLYKQCPFFVPYFLPHSPNQNEKDYFISLGYRFTEDQMEPQEQYLKRLFGMQRLYSAILITKQKRELQSMEHPHGLENGWTWFSAFINLEPLPEISATLLLEFLQVCGNDMWQIYKKQFTKLLIALQQVYMPKLDKIDCGGPNARLSVFIGNIIRENRISPPNGTLSPNFW